MKETFMKAAILEAKKAERLDEVPIGAVIVKDGRIIARGYNSREKKQNAILHAEMVAIQRACKKLGSWRLSDCDIYVTAQPCPMCAGGIVCSRIKKVYFGAYDNKGGSDGLTAAILQDGRQNHKTDMEGGVLQEECSRILSQYFKKKR